MGTPIKLQFIKAMRAAAYFLIIIGSVAQAKDLANRLGVGPKNNFSFDLPSIATVYYPNADFGVTGALGLDTQDKASKFAFQVGLRKIIFKEDNMNFYMGGGAALISMENTTKTESGFEMNGHVGGEFFFSGLDSLGFNFETGIAVTSIDKVRFRTFGDSPIRGGIIFYF